MDVLWGSYHLRCKVTVHSVTTMPDGYTAARSNWIHVDFVECLIISATVRLPKATRSMPTRCVGIPSPQIASAFSHDGACIIDHIHTDRERESYCRAKTVAVATCVYSYFFFFAGLFVGIIISLFCFYFFALPSAPVRQRTNR